MLSSLTEIVCICVCGCGLPHKRRFVIICARRCLKRQRWFHCRRTTAALLPSYSNILLKNVSEMTHVVTFSARAELKLRIHYEIGCGQQQCEYNRYMMFQCAWNTTYPLSVCYIWCCCSEVGEKISQNISAVCKVCVVCVCLLIELEDFTTPHIVQRHHDSTHATDGAQATVCRLCNFIHSLIPLCSGAENIRV